MAVFIQHLKPFSDSPDRKCHHLSRRGEAAQVRGRLVRQYQTASLVDHRNAVRHSLKDRKQQIARRPESLCHE